MNGFLLLHYVLALTLFNGYTQDVHAAHASGPVSLWDYAITWIAIGIVLITLILSILYLIYPEKYDKGTIKYIAIDL